MPIAAPYLNDLLSLLHYDVRATWKPLHVETVANLKVPQQTPYCKPSGQALICGMVGLLADSPAVFKLLQSISQGPPAPLPPCPRMVSGITLTRS